MYGIGHLYGLKREGAPSGADHPPQHDLMENLEEEWDCQSFSVHKEDHCQPHCHRWNTVAAIDVLNLDLNEGKGYGGDLALIFAGNCFA